MRKRGSTRLFLTGVIAGMVLLGVSSVGAVSANISHSYRSQEAIQSGSIVSLDAGRSDYIVPANTDNSSRLLGVAVAKDDSLIAVNEGVGGVQVATSGSAPILVSTLNGDIHIGDPVGVSPFNGVGIKALEGSRMIGLAQSAFDAHTAGATQQRVTDKQGRASTVSVGYAQVNIAISTNANVLSVSNLNALQKAAKTLTGRTVATQRIIISLVVALVAVIALVTLVYASIYGSIVSIGRNPLAKYAVFRTLGSVLGLAVLTTVIAGLIIFLLLR